MRAKKDKPEYAGRSSPPGELLGFAARMAVESSRVNGCEIDWWIRVDHPGNPVERRIEEVMKGGHMAQPGKKKPRRIVALG